MRTKLNWASFLVTSPPDLVGGIYDGTVIRTILASGSETYLNDVSFEKCILRELDADTTIVSKRIGASTVDHWRRLRDQLRNLADLIEEKLPDDPCQLAEVIARDIKDRPAVQVGYLLRWDYRKSGPQAVFTLTEKEAVALQQDLEQNGWLDVDRFPVFGFPPEHPPGLGEDDPDGDDILDFQNP